MVDMAAKKELTDKVERMLAGVRAAGLKLTPQLAAQAYAVATDPVEGMAKDAKFDMEGFKNTLKLRAEIEGQWGGKPPSPEKYIDLSYYDRAMADIR